MIGFSQGHIKTLGAELEQDHMSIRSQTQPLSWNPFLSTACSGPIPAGPRTFLGCQISSPHPTSALLLYLKRPRELLVFLGLVPHSFKSHQKPHQLGEDKVTLDGSSSPCQCPESFPPCPPRHAHLCPHLSALTGLPPQPSRTLKH